MSVAAAFFYLFAFVLVASAFMVISSRNPVQSVLFLILAFVNAAGLFFLFVAMMLDVDFVELRQGFLQYLPVGVVVGMIFLAELVLVVGAWATGPGVASAVQSAPGGIATESNVRAIAAVLYTDYIYFFQAAGFVLLVAMIGAIVLTLCHKVNVRRQNITAQVTRYSTIEVVKVRPGQGL